MTELALVVSILLGLGLGIAIIATWQRIASISRRLGESESIESRLDAMDKGLYSHVSSASTDLATRLEKTTGDLRQDVSDRFADGFKQIRESLDQQLSSGRDEQAKRISQTTSQLETKFELLRSTTDTKLQDFGTRQVESLERLSHSLSQGLSASRSELTEALTSNLDKIRDQVDQRLLLITEKVELKLEQNIREGFSHFQKVQEHLQSAEEQLRNVGALGDSINDLNSILKLPHLRGKFGEASLERILADFLPSPLYELQASIGDEGRQRVDAVINFPEYRLPIDAKFPREQVLPLFDSSNPEEIEKARTQLARVIKEQARRITSYIQPECGTTDMALMYLPSETLYLEVIRSREISDYLTEKRVFPVSPNTLLMSLQSVALVFKWYQVAQSFEKTTEALGKAQHSFGLFQARFEAVGKNLEKVQESYSTASGHLSRYRNRVSKLTEETDSPESPRDDKTRPPSSGDVQE